MHAMRHIAPTILALALVTSAAAATSDDAEPSHNNTTAWREQEQGGWNIRTVYYDLRTSVPYGAEPGMVMPSSSATIHVGMEQERYVWNKDSILSSPPGGPVLSNRTPLIEDRRAYTAVWRQGLWTPWTWDAQLEVHAGFTQRSTPESGQAGIRDTDVLLLAPLYTERYASVLVGLGMSLPTGTKGDWMNAHGKTGYLATLRTSALIADWTTLSVSIDGGFVSGAKESVYTAPTPVDATCDYRKLAVAATLGRRLSTHWAFGVSQRYEEHWFNTITVPGQYEVPSERTVSAPTSLYVTLMAPARTTWALSVARDYVSNRGMGVDHPIMLGLSVEAVTW